MTRMMTLLLAGWSLAAWSAYGGGSLAISVTDAHGAADGQVVYSIWDGEEEAYVPLHGRSLQRGTDRIALAPGRYAVHVVYTGARPEQHATLADIEIGHGDAIEHAFYFGRGEAVFRARDSKWRWNSDAEIFLYRRDAATQELELVHSRRLSHRRRQTGFDLAPGVYRARIAYTETRPRSEAVETEFEVRDGERVSVLALFQQGPMPTRRKHQPTERRGPYPALTPNEALTRYTDPTD